MIKTTKAQRGALWKLYARAFLQGEGLPVKTYRQFRRDVQPCFDGSGAIMVPWAGIWIGIETDGYAHS